MITITWGAGGQFPTRVLAYQSSPESWGTDYLFLQVGEAASSTGVVMTKNQNGFQCEFQGNGNLEILTTPFVTINSAPTGKLVITGMNSIVSEAVIRINIGSTYYLSNELHCLRNRFKGDITSIIFHTSGCAHIGLLFMSNLVESTANMRFIGYGSTPWYWTNTYIEDCIVRTTSAFDFSSDKRMYAQIYNLRRLYIEHNGQSAGVRDARLSSEVYVSGEDNDTYMPQKNKSIPVNGNFISLDPTNIGYMVPRLESKLYTDASQVSDVRNNIGINEIEYTRRVISCSASPVQIPSPTGLKWKIVPEGIEVTWNTPPVAGFTRSAIYWEISSAPTAFTAPKAHVAEGNTSYLIPKALLSSSKTWYVDVRHVQ